MLEPEEALEILSPALVFIRWRNGVTKESRSQFGFPRKRPQDKDLRVSDLCERFSQECQQGSGQVGQGRGGSLKSRCIFKRITAVHTWSSVPRGNWGKQSTHLSVILPKGQGSADIRP